jgi:hypothetical protein
MKNIFLSLLLGTSFIGLSQETTSGDALRYAVEDLNGTARFRAMSGSMGAIGGDLSAININPAGSVVFKYNTFSATVSGFNQKNNSTYFGTRYSENDFKLDINQIGAVFVFDNTSENSDWKKLSFAINYENTNNFNNQLFSKGTNPYNSIGNYFVNASQGYQLEFLQTQPGESVSSLYNYLGETGGLGFGAQQAMLGYQGYIVSAFDDTDSNNVDYFTNIPVGGNYYQESYIKSKGYNGKLTGNFAANYNDILSLGMNLNIHFTDYTKSSSVYESNNNPEYTTGSTVKRIQFNNDLYTYGRGFSLNLGAIAKVTDEFRLGLAYESPTWYALNDELSQRLVVVNSDENGTYTDVVDPNVVNIYPNYNVQTPSKWTGSAAYIFGSSGFLNVDVSSKDYSTTTFRPKNDLFYASLNDNISANLKNTISYNIGGEYKIKQISLRAGYRFEESPYKVDTAFGDLIGYSGGLGYSFNNARIDLSYANTHRNYNQSFISSGMNDQARINNKNDNVSLSYSVSF